MTHTERVQVESIKIFYNALLELPQLKV